MIYLDVMINTLEEVFPGFNHRGNCYSIILYTAQLSVKNQIKPLSIIQRIHNIITTHTFLRKIIGVLHKNEKLIKKESKPL